MTLDLTVPAQLAFALLPEIVLTVGALILLLWAAWRPASAAHQRHVGLLALVVLAATAVAVAWFAAAGPAAGYGLIAVDNFRWAADGIFLLGAICTIAMSLDYKEREGITAAESHVLVLLSLVGMMLLAAARDLILVFLGIEIMSVAVYVLTGINRRSPQSAEGSLKYFLLGAFSTAFLLYGITLLYGATGTTVFAGIAAGAATPIVQESATFRLGIGLLIVGLGFKVAAVPFHMWAPDAYDGAPTPISAFMAATVKAAGFAAFLRVFIEALAPAAAEWHLALWWLAGLTMVGGNVIALAQRNIKRMLAYSSIAHAGYILVAIVVGANVGTEFGVTGSSAFLFYLLAYTLSTMGAFAVVSVLSGKGDPYLDMRDYSGLWTVRPGLTLAMSVFMLGLLGFPVFGGIGFFAKWYMLQAALRGGATPEPVLAFAIVFTSVLSAGYYLYVVTIMFVRPRDEKIPEPEPVRRFTGAVIVGTVVLIMFFGFAPSRALSGAIASALQPTVVEAPTAPLLPGGG